MAICDKYLSLDDRSVSPLSTIGATFQFADRREDEMAAIPLAIVAASIGASIYMAFIWRPEQQSISKRHD